MNRELSMIASWLSANKRSLNIKKTHFTIFKSRGKKSLYIDDEFTQEIIKVRE